MLRTKDRIDINEELHLTVIDYSDAKRLAELLNDKDIYAVTASIPYPYTLADANAFIASVIEFEKSNRMQKDWVIRNCTGQLIGGIGLLLNYGPDAHKSEIGYWLGKPYWGRGIMTQVVQIFSDRILSSGRLVRVEALVYEENSASSRVLEKAGFEREGFHRKAIVKDGDYKNVWHWARIS